jgi:flavin-dependent dehydrogenase
LAVAPANTARLEAFAGTDWLAVGDAAVAYDPLSSYGVTAALGTGLHAADAIQGLIAGRLQTMTDYSQLQERAFSAIWAQQTDLYAAERRWTDKRFWRRRHSAPKV